MPSSTSHHDPHPGIETCRFYGERRNARRCCLGILGASAACAAFFMLSICGATTAFAGNTLPQASELDALIQPALQEFEVPGIAIGVWTPNGSWVRTAGLADAGAGRPVKLRDHFAIRSITKSFVVTLILQLVAQGNGSVTLDDPIGRYVAGVPNGDRITLRELANMTSGLFDYTRDPKFGVALQADLTRSWTTDELLAFAFDGQTHPVTVFEPGTQYQYSNTNTLLLGKVVEKLTDDDFDHVLETKILSPLALDNTAYLNGTRIPSPAAIGYLGETPEGQPDAIKVSFSGLGFSGAMSSTLKDLGNWGRALATGTLLPVGLQQQRFQAHSTKSDPSSPIYDAYGLGMGQVAGWWGHTGSGLGFEAAVFHHIGSQETFAILLNASNHTDVPVRIFCRVLHVLNEAVPAGSVCAAANQGRG